MRRASDAELRIMHESKLHTENCFVTLTYAPGNLPPNGTLQHRDFQLYMKRLRKRTANTVRYYMCGEYGPETSRPHYHACLFGKDYTDRKEQGKSESGELHYHSQELEGTWGLGRVSVQDLNERTAAYCARYIMTKKLGKESRYEALDPETGELIPLAPEYSKSSLGGRTGLGGIGKGYFEQFYKDFYRKDACVQNGVKRTPPKYYDKLYERVAPQHMQDEVKYKRELRARAHHEDQTPERLKTRETVHLAKIRNLKRTEN